MGVFADETWVSSAVCMICGRRFEPDWLDGHYVCPDHGPKHNQTHDQDKAPDLSREGILDLAYDYAQAAKSFPDPAQPGMWRYRSLLPLPATAATPPLQVGLTPLLKADRLGRELGLDNLYVKDDSRQPTGSLKDRASALAASVAAWRKYPVIATASTGNAAAALAGICASMGQACVIFVPEGAPGGKLAQLQAYGAKVFLVRGSYDQAFELCQQACARYGWYNRNTGYNPLMAEGKKTVAFEIAEQMGWRTPDALFVGTGDGCILAGVHKGFADLLRLGLTANMPRLFSVQAAGSDFMCRAFEEKRFSPAQILDKTPITAKTRADSICAGLPRDRLKAMRAVLDSRGAFIRVSDAQILAAVPELAAKTGIFAEPAGAACLAGLRAALADGLLDAESTVCLLVTGSGLKDPSALGESSLPRPQTINPALEDLAGFIGN